MTGFVKDEYVRLCANYNAMHCNRCGHCHLFIHHDSHCLLAGQVTKQLAQNHVLATFICYWVGLCMLAFSGSPLDAVSICLVIIICNLLAIYTQVVRQLAIAIAQQLAQQLDIQLGSQPALYQLVIIIKIGSQLYSQVASCIVIGSWYVVLN